MELRKNGFLYKVAYGLRKNKPEQSNLCRFFWRVILSVIFFWLPYGIWKGIIDYGLIRFLIGAPVAFLLFGYRPMLQREWPVEYGAIEFPFEPIPRWFKFNGEHVFPAQAAWYLGLILLALGVIGLMFYTGAKFIWHHPWMALLGLAVLSLLVLWALDRDKKVNESRVTTIAKEEGKEAHRLFATYVKAKKDKVCPIIQFVENPAT